MDAPVANGFVHQFGGHRAINAATDGTYNPTSLATDFANASDFLPNKFLLRRHRVSAHISIHQAIHIYVCTYHSPIVLAATNIVHEPGDDLLSPRGVRHLWVELNAVERFRIMRDGGIGRGCRMANDVEIWRWRGELIAVGHPHLRQRSAAGSRTRSSAADMGIRKERSSVVPPYRRPILRTRHRQMTDHSQTC